MTDFSTWKAVHRGPLRIANCNVMITEIQTIEGGWKNVSSLEGTTFKIKIIKNGQ